MSSSSSQIASPSNTTATGQGAAVGEISRLKRQLAVLQEELDELNLGKIKKPQYVRVSSLNLHISLLIGHLSDWVGGFGGL